MSICKYWQLWHQKEIENAKNCGFFSTVIDALFASSLETSIGPQGLNDSAMQNIREEAMRYFEETIEKSLNGFQDEDSFTMATAELACNLERSIGLEKLDDSAMQNIREEAQRYFEKGSCRLENDIKIVCLNPTILEHATLSWTLYYSLCPFDGYMPLLKEELDISIKSKMMIRSCQKILKNLLSCYRKRLIDGKTFEFFFYLEDAIEFCYSENVNKFDVIDCSSIADHVGLVNLILACSGKLSHQQCCSPKL
jgi:hypothetical protein